MPNIYYLRDGAPPNNVTCVKKIDLEYIKENFNSSSFKYLAPISNEPPIINAHMGAANEYSSPNHVILGIFPKDIELSQFEKPGFYVVEDVTPKLT